MRGICIVALGYRIYGEMAANLAASLRVVSPNVHIALLYDSDGINTLTEEHLKLFNQRIEIGGDEITVADSKHYQIAKLLVYKYSPFDFTIYIDADSLWGDKPVEDLFERFKDESFYVGAHSIYDKATQRLDALGYTHWCRPYEACVYHNLDWIQQTISGLFYFKKCQLTEDLFITSLKVYFDPDTPNFIWANGKPDEYCFNVALAKHGIKLDRNSLIYFDKLHGKADEGAMFSNHYGIAIGGHKIEYNLRRIYDRRAHEACQKLNVSSFASIEKSQAIQSRNNKKNAVLM